MTKFTKYSPQPYAAMEHQILDFWKKNRVFEASIEQRSPNKTYVFYDGPPFITGLPHHGTLLSSIIKDVVPRYQTMRGYRIERRWGWDCHGLPAENFVEKKLNLPDKQAVLDYGLEKYIVACRQNMIQTGSLWEKSIERIGRWVEFKNAYKTMDASYMESVWWAFKQLYDRGKIYEGEKVLMYCTRCATPVSKVEIAMDQSYQEVSDPSVYVKFKLTVSAVNSFLKTLNLDLGVTDLNLLAWTTTPWTLPANTAIAIQPSAQYVLVEFESEFFVLAHDLIDQVFENSQRDLLKVIASFDGHKLSGLTYQPLFDHQGDRAHQVLEADYVTVAEGSGVVHLAPAYGEEDYLLAQKLNIPIVKNIDDNGLYKKGEWQGRNVWQVNPEIAKQLLKQGHLFKLATIKHSYPHCHRCQTRLMYKAHPSWFLDIASHKEKMLSDNQDINWFPAHIKDGRFKDIMQTAPDWNISRDRMWATPLPVWRGIDSQTGQQKTIVVGSYQELTDLSGQTLTDYHRPWVDKIEFEKDGVVFKRVDKVLDCWFESGSMPFAQHHYPFENQDFLKDNFPADFIVEYVGQVRAWFYYLHVLGVALFAKPAFKNVIVTGTILGDDGRKISKSLGNYTDPLELIETYSADAYRLVLVDSPVLAGEDFSLLTKDVADKQRKLDTLRHTLQFFLLYATADNWQADPQRHNQAPMQSTNLFDQWLLAKLSSLNTNLTNSFNSYNLPAATKPLFEFIEDLSNWYVRRNRKRFWKTDNDSDKEAAYHTLYFVLRQTAHLIAPICPFIAEEIQLQLAADKKSIHLADWPDFRFEADDLVSDMQRIRIYITDGLAQRAQAGIKVRQPLTKLTIFETDSQSFNLPQQLEAIILEELNVKALEFKVSKMAKVELDTQLTPHLQQEGLVRELVRQIQILRKKANLEVENRIKLALRLDDSDLLGVFKQFEDYITSQTLATQLTLSSQASSYEHQHKIVLGKTETIIALTQDI